ncbi:MAG: Lrp/AsnC family transcriptional regulator [Candidatus Bathyarchaeota archaeon]|nr:Lrp/AsnC family transcriptional regulator [Candidatus Bathyarchaeota archaeon]
MIIDDIDAKILVQLLRDGRKKFSDIANETNVSLDIICQHYKKMEKNGIITGSTLLIDYRALGYSINLNISLSVPFQKQETTIERLREIPGLYDVYQLGNKSDIMVTMHLTNNKEFEEIKQIVRSLPCMRVNFDIWTSARVSMTNLSVFSDEDSSSNRDISKTEANTSNWDSIKLDELDKSIIEQLVFNCRTTFGSLAKKTGNSISTIMRRYNRLRRDDIILPTIQINTSKLGYPADAMFKLKANAQSNLNKITKTISKIPDVYAIFNTFGAYDYIVYSCVKNLEHFLNLEEQISAVPDVQEICNATILPPIPDGLPFLAMQKSTF